MPRIILTIVFLLAIAVEVQAAATGDILTDDAVANADDAALAAEAGTFDTLRQGIAISLARCEAEHCVPSVSKGELDRLIKKLNSRISVLSTRYQESGDKQLESILLSYASSRDSYNGFLEKLNALAPAEEQKEEGFPEEDIQFNDEF